MKKALKKTQIKIDDENEKKEKEMNELTLSQQKILQSNYMIRDDDNNNMKIDNTTNWMTDDDDDDQFMQDSLLHSLLSNQSSIPIVMSVLLFSLYSIWEIISSFTLLKQITSLKNIFS